MSNAKMAKKAEFGDGFIAALDQSGGSTPKALGLYGVTPDKFANDDEMFDLIHDMRSRIVMSPAFIGDHVMGTVLFEMTMDRGIGGKPSARYMWEDRGVVPFLKVDKGLEDAADGCQLMKPMPTLDDVCKRAVSHGIYGTKMRSVVSAANATGIQNIVAQQFATGAQIARHGLMPILEPEVTISIADKAEAEAMLRDEILTHLEALPEGHRVMLKLTLPENVNYYKSLIDHPKVVRVAALSGGYDRDEANTRLSKNSKMIASFSRALTQGLSAQQSDADFDATLAAIVKSIYDASVAG